MRSSGLRKWCQSAPVVQPASAANSRTVALSTPTRATIAQVASISSLDRCPRAGVADVSGAAVK